MNSFHKRWLNPIESFYQKPLYRTGLKILNSLCKEKVEFISKNANHIINWYMCGPTMLNSVDPGQARTYLTFDIIRRILTNYFCYEVNVCMNITNIGDCIIKESKEHQIDYMTFSKMKENEFFKDMENLNILYPTYITRVTEYIPEIISFIDEIIKKGLAYENKGCVYFDVHAYINKGNSYPILVTKEHAGNYLKKKEIEGMFDLPLIGERKSKFDFALWKSSKEGEPSWDSPWGKGRPGWHIECSSMCLSNFSECVDIHSGAEGLKFPHHDNEIALLKAHNSSCQYVNYFLHSGHLNYERIKMSKKFSDYTNYYNPNTFRLFFSKFKWEEKVDFTEKGLRQADDENKKIIRFFWTIKRWIKDYTNKTEMKLNQNDIEIDNIFKDAKSKIHDAFCDNFNTPLVLNITFDLMKTLLQYIENYKEQSKFNLIYTISRFIAFVLRCFGLIYNTDFLEFFIENNLQSKAIEQIKTPFIKVLKEFRDKVKVAAEDNKSLDEIMKLCDELRDNIIPHYGVLIEDSSDFKSNWKFRTREKI